MASPIPQNKKGEDFMAAQTNEIRKADDAFEQTFWRGDSAGMAELYTEDGMLLPTGRDFIKGKKAIREFWQGAMDMGVKEAKLDIVEVEGQGDAVIEVGRYRLSGAGGEMMDQGKYIVIWKQDEGRWKLHRDIWNSSEPPQGR
jgi:uncharacterized protein (TIGR02246 family)